MTYEELRKANEGIKTLNVKGKDYAMVNQRVNAFKRVYPDGFITTVLISNEGGLCVFQAHCGFYDEDGEARVLGTGTAYERETSSYINKTSYIENCETSAVGRALGFAGFGIDTSIASAEEVENAINQQEAPKEPTFTPASPKGAEQEAKPEPPNMTVAEMIDVIRRLYSPDQQETLAKNHAVASVEDITEDELSVLMGRLRKAGKI